MKRIKGVLFKITIVWVFIIVVGVLSGLPSSDELSIEWIRLRLLDGQTLASLFVVAIAFVILSKLRYVFVWLGVLIVLAILGLGIDLPPRFVQYPERLSIVRVSLTLVIILVCWILEKLESKYIGLETSGLNPGNSYEDEIEVIALNLDTDPGEEKGRHA